MVESVRSRDAARPIDAVEAFDKDEMCWVSFIIVGLVDSAIDFTAPVLRIFETAFETEVVKKRVPFFKTIGTLDTEIEKVLNRTRVFPIDAEFEAATVVICLVSLINNGEFETVASRIGNNKKRPRVTDAVTVANRVLRVFVVPAESLI